MVLNVSRNMLRHIYFLFLSIFNILSLIIFVSEILFDRTLPEHVHYDYIIVGSGSAGGNLHDLRGKVLLLEAGGYGSTFIFNIPIAQPLLLRSNYDHKHETASQKNSCKGLNDNKSFWPTGKIVGGTTRLNNMIYHRSHNYENILSEQEAEKYYKKVEDEVEVSERNFKSKLSHAFIEGATELGFEDFGYTNSTQKHGRRYSQLNNFGSRIKNPPEVVANALVTRIIFDQKSPKKAIGVEFNKNGENHKVYANKIVLSAGTLGSPKILMHSGIGPRDHLESLGIKVVEDLPVGKNNLQDHVTTPITLLLNQSIGITVSEIFNPIKIIKYLLTGRDTIFSFGGSDAMGFMKFNQTHKTPDLSLISMPTTITFDLGVHLRKIINLRDEIWQHYYEPLIGQTSATLLPILLHPLSKGSIHLRSKNFKDSLLIDPNYLDNQDDVDKLIKGIRIIQKLVETPPMKQLGAELIPKSLPGCENEIFDSNEYWDCYIRHMTLTMFHPTGSCKLGDENEESTVVLKNFQVKNIENLYVIDASILPHPPSANPHAVISMLAQKFSHDMNSLT